MPASLVTLYALYLNSYHITRGITKRYNQQHFIATWLNHMHLASKQ